ncbi:MAG: dimethyl sulfoxide reductase anchor subunit [Pirellulaceae bacterium]|nr:dimethyl sulfoxide reductase anchor subunit [Pirellulaceae bacterium]
MSTTLPVVQPSLDLVEQLLAEQQSLTAVEQFSALHEAGDGRTFGEPDQARYYQKLLPATAPQPGQQFSFEVDLDQCSGCKACVVACHTLNGLDEDESWRRVGTLTIGEQAPRIQHVTTACHHCEDPGCLNGCPVKAYDKDPVTGIVRHLDDQCIGCKYCTMMCPYEVPQYSERLGIVRKCDMCHQRLSAGEAPACVQSCPNEAIAIRIVDVASDRFSDTDTLAAGAPPSTITKPTTIYKSNALTGNELAVPQDHQVDSIAESHWPLAVMLVATQISVGILLAERVAALLAILIGSQLPIAATQYATVIALMIAGAGMGIAPLHLGQPLRAWRVFLGLRTSWLSREAVVLGKYMGLLTATVALTWMPLFAEYLPSLVTDLIPSWAAKATLVVTLITGVAGLASSAMIYVATKRQLWRTDRTFTRFFGTTIVAGAAWMVPVFLFVQGSSPLTLLVTLATVAVVAGKLCWEWTHYLAPQSTGDEYQMRSSQLVHGPLAKTTQLRIKTAIAGLGLLLLATVFGWITPVVGALMGGAAAIAISGGEYCERLLYFQSVVYDRMPGTLK